MAQGGLSPLRKWLQCVDDHLTSEPLEFLKLCLYSEVNSFGIYQSIKTPTKLFDFLLEKRYKSDETKTLQVFTHALKRVGGDLRGTYLVETCLPKYDLICPPPLNEEELSNEFKFCLCLVKIGTKSRGLNLELKLKIRFSRPRFLHIHYENLQHLPDLFVKLIQRGFIHWNDTHHLREAFEKYGARQCLKYLNQYYRMVGLTPIPFVDGDEADTSPSSAMPSALDETSDVLSAGEKRKMMCPPRPHTQELMMFGSQPKDVLVGNHLKLEVEYSQSAPQQNSHFPPPKDKSKGLRDYTDKDSDSDLSEEDDKSVRRNLVKESKPTLSVDHESHVPPLNRGSRRMRQKLFGIFIATLFCLVLFGVLFGTTWFHLFPNKPVHTEGTESTTIILKEVNNFFIRSIIVSEFLPTDSHKVVVYYHDAVCGELPSEKNMQTMTEFVNFRNVYFLSGSRLEYDLVILPPNRSSDGDHMSIYLTKGIQIAEFNPHRVQSQDILIQDRVYFDGQPHHGSYEVPKGNSGYYNINFLPSPFPDIKYDLNLTLNTRIISTTDLEYVCTVTSERDCKKEFLFSASKSCLVGDILNTTASGTFLDISIDVVAFWLAPVLGITFVLFVMASVTVLAVACFVPRCCK